MYRVLSLSAAALALALVAVNPTRAAESVHEGHVVQVAAGTLTLAGDDKKEFTHDVAKDAAITLDGKKAKLDDLKPHMHAKVTMDDKHTITKIEAHSHDEK